MYRRNEDFTPILLAFRRHRDTTWVIETQADTMGFLNEDVCVGLISSSWSWIALVSGTRRQRF